MKKKVNQAPFSYYTANKYGEIEGVNHSFEFELEVNEETYLKLTVKSESTATNPVGIKVYLNGLVGFSGQIDEITALTEILMPFSKGVNKIKIEYFSEIPFFLTKCTLETFGNIKYVEKDCILMNINEENRSLILFITDGVAVVKEYKDGVIKTLYYEENIKSGVFCKMGEKYLLALVDKNGDGYLKEMTASFKVDYQKLFDTQLISVCALSGNIPSVFAVRGNKVYRYNVEEMLFCVKRSTGYFGKKVSANPEVSNYIIITNYDDSAKLVTV